LKDVFIRKEKKRKRWFIEKNRKEEKRHLRFPWKKSNPGGIKEWGPAKRVGRTGGIEKGRWWNLEGSKQCASEKSRTTVCLHWRKGDAFRWIVAKRGKTDQED